MELLSGFAAREAGVEMFYSLGETFASFRLLNLNKLICAADVKS